ncbi:MAG: phosphatase PAP2 family protein [Nanoarchaeota archaeon]|nr:phosphatase PAP2 family protein [Nanoarchaeota archaeon]MBU1631813.1 phosphatase PAP2 family protein [Nanoarchaeota archaeon]
MSLLKNGFIENISALGALPFFLMTISILFLLNQTKFATQLLVGIIIGHIVTYLIRLMYHKERPQPQKYNSLVERIDASSFPSLHSVRAMTFSMICAINTGYLVSYLIFGTYLLSILYSRYYLKKHDLKDIIMGAIIGLFISAIIIFISSYFI